MSWIQVLPGGETVEVNPYYQSPVENSTLIAPPEDASIGNRYLLINAPTAGTAFAGYQYHIATRTPLGWDFTVPLEGMRVYDKALDKEWTYSVPGYWALSASSGATFGALLGLPSDNVALAAELNGKASTSHTHTGVYSASDHTHADLYSALGHTHADTYAALGHAHPDEHATVDHTHPVVTTSANGFMTSEDKIKLDGLEAYGATTHAGYALSTNQTITTGTSAAVALDTEILDPEAAFSLSSNAIVLRLGKAYLVNWTLSGYGDTANTKSKVAVALQQGPTSWTTVANSATVFQTPDSANADNQVFTHSGYGVVTTTSGDDRNLRLYVTTEASWGGIVIDKDKSRIDVIELTAWGGGGGAGVWGFITGTIANQADLVAAFSAIGHTHSDATGSVAGFLSAADKTKLDGIEASADVNQTAEQIADALDTYLGSSDWRTGGAGGSGGDTLQAAYYNSTQSSQIAAGSTGTFNFDLASYLRSGNTYTVSNGEITITDTGTFNFLAQAAVVSDTANTKSIATVTLETDNSGSFATLPGGAAVVSVYNSTTTTGYQISHITVFGSITFATSGKKVRVRVSPSVGWAPVKTALGGWIKIWKEGSDGGGAGSSTGALGTFALADGATGFTADSGFLIDTTNHVARIPRSMTACAVLSAPTWTGNAASIMAPIATPNNYLVTDTHPAVSGVTDSVLTVNAPSAPAGAIDGFVYDFSLTVRNTSSTNILKVVMAGFIPDGAIAQQLRLYPGDAGTLHYWYRINGGTAEWWCAGVPMIDDRFEFDWAGIAVNDYIVFPARRTIRVPAWQTDAFYGFIPGTTATATTVFNLQERYNTVWTNRFTLTFTQGQAFGVWSVTPAIVSTNMWRLLAPAALNGITRITGGINIGVVNAG